MSFDLQLRTSYIFVKYIYTVHHVEDFSRYFPIDHGGRGGGGWQQIPADTAQQGSD